MSDENAGRGVLLDAAAVRVEQFKKEAQEDMARTTENWDQPLTSQMTTREKVLREAITVVTKDRNSQYGEPEDVFTDIAAGWSVLFDADITPHLVCLAMDWLKVVRSKHNPSHRDNYIDGPGYWACAAEAAGVER